MPLLKFNFNLLIIFSNYRTTMRKKILIGLLAVPLFFGSCSSDDNEVIPPVSTLTPDMQKKMLIDTGIAFMNRVDPNDHKELIETMQVLADLMESYPLEKEVKESFSLFARSIMDVVYKSNPYKLSDVNRAVNEIVSLDEYLGIYRFDSKNKYWTFTPGNTDLQAYFIADGKEATIRITPSKDIVTINNENKEIQIPTSIGVTVNRGNSVIAQYENTLSIKNDIAKESLILRTGESVLKADFQMSTSEGTALFEMVRGKETLLSAQTKIKGTNLDDIFKDAATENNFAEASASCVVMDNLQLNSECTNVAQLIRKTEKIEEEYDYSDFSAQAQKKYATDYSNCINEYVITKLFIEGTWTADVQMMPYVSVEENYNTSYEYWDYEPILYFHSDGSKHSFTDFFNEADFAKVITDFESLFNRYRNFFK